MRTLLIGLAVTLAGSAVAQQAPPPPKTFTSAADVAAMIAKAKTDRKQDQANFIQQILRLAPYNTVNLEYRAAVGPAAVHEKEAELFFVIDGSGTLVTGGKLAGETRNGDNLSGTAIDGGDSKPVAKGDFFIVPEGIPHWFSKINGTLVLMSFHVAKPPPK
jgi:mannose-6-phosphate isomerase-like protein (cupin superfamily)